MHKQIVTVAVVAVALALVVCKGDGPSPSPIGPNMPVIPAPTVQPTNPPTTPPAPTDSTKGWITWSKVGGEVHGDVTAGADGYFGIACCKGPMDRPADQELVGGQTADLNSGQDLTLTAPLACGVRNQCDFFYGLSKPKPHCQYGGALIAGEYFVGEPCPPGVPPPPPCKPIGKPECPEQIWDYDSCTWVGECVCEPLGEPPDCCADQPSCGPPPPPEQICECLSEWSYETCEWDQECVCECPEVKPPRCSEHCVFDEDLCVWVCDYPECDPGFQFNPRTCECQAYLMCHVSNKGTDQDWNLQEHTVPVTPGHLGHLDDCPPDYLGVCDGRSASWTPDMCEQ